MTDIPQIQLNYKSQMNRLQKTFSKQKPANHLRFTRSTIHTYIQLEGVKFNVYLACCPGGGLRAWNLPELRLLPPYM